MTQYFLLIPDGQQERNNLNALINGLQAHFTLQEQAVILLTTNNETELDPLLSSLALLVVNPTAPRPANGKPSAPGKQKPCEACGTIHERRSRFCSTNCYHKSLAKQPKRAMDGVVNGKINGGK